MVCDRSNHKDGKQEPSMCQALCWLLGRSYVGILERSWGPDASGREIKHQPSSYSVSIYTACLHRAYGSFRGRNEWEKSRPGFGSDHCSGFCGCLPSIHFFPYDESKPITLTLAILPAIHLVVTKWPNPAGWEKRAGLLWGRAGAEGTGKGVLDSKEIWAEVTLLLLDFITKPENVASIVLTHEDNTWTMKLLCFARAAGTQNWVASNSGNVLSHSSGGEPSEIKVSAGPRSLWRILLASSALGACWQSLEVLGL